MNKQPQIYHTIQQLRQQLQSYQNQKIGLVPTMGNLHDGHLQLVKIAQQHCDIVVVSIFVNPTQFGVGEDFDSYPRTLSADIEKLASVQTDLVFAPSVEEMYPTLPPQTHISMGDIAKKLCGKSRPTHFDGVGIVVSKLFNIVQPDIAVFGKKDYQQLAIIRQLVAELNFNIEIIGADIVRSADGLALSSRNQYLTTEQRAIAPRLQQCLQQLKNQLQQANFTEFDNLVQKSKDYLNNHGFNVDYLALYNPQLQPLAQTDSQAVLLVASWLGNARLLDNLEFNLTK